MKKSIYLLLCFSVPFLLTAQPHLSGTIKINATKGLISCSFTLSKLPALKEYRILLNKGMNIKEFVDASNKAYFYEGFYEGKNRGEATEYFFSTNGNDTLRPLPNSFSIAYTGAFPVYDKSVNIFDFKGFIACNGQTMRASEQSKWYPVIYDVANDRLIDTYTYDIQVEATDTKTVYINGTLPKYMKGVQGFATTTPRQLLLFAGNYDFISRNGNYLLNTGVDTATGSKIFSQLDQIKKFLATKLQLPYQENIFLISHKAVKKMNPENSWGFTVFPSFAYAGLNFKTLLTPKGRFDDNNLAFFAHELSHAYFGPTTLSGNIYWFWLESTTEYLSLKALQQFGDTAEFKRVMNNYKNLTARSSFLPLATITSNNQIDGDYRYVYGPLLWFCFEALVGEERSYKTLQQIIKNAPAETLTIASWKKAAMAAGVESAAFDRFQEIFLEKDINRKQLTTEIERYLLRIK